ncbi:MAG: amidohydrolase family protein, partial [Fibrobacteres bacterium]|nr:amidohydrolase family protein [Fibrobacterota bacterium]
VSGMKEAEALALITSVNADILGIGDRVGRIEKGLLASMLVWDRDPLRLDAIPKVVIAEGKILSHQKYTR